MSRDRYAIQDVHTELVTVTVCYEVLCLHHIPFGFSPGKLPQDANATGTKSKTDQNCCLWTSQRHPSRPRVSPIHPCNNIQTILHWQRQRIALQLRHRSGYSLTNCRLLCKTYRLLSSNKWRESREISCLNCDSYNQLNYASALIDCLTKTLFPSATLSFHVAEKVLDHRKLGLHDYRFIWCHGI